MSCALLDVSDVSMCLTGRAIGWLMQFIIPGDLLCLSELVIEGVAILLQVSSERRKVASIR